MRIEDVSSDALFSRLRCMACAEWHVLPPVFDAACERGEIALEDVFELVIYKAGEPILGARVIPYLMREAVDAAEDRLRRAQGLMMQMRATRDEAERARIARELDLINRR